MSRINGAKWSEVERSGAKWSRGTSGAAKAVEQRSRGTAKAVEPWSSEAAAEPLFFITII